MTWMFPEWLFALPLAILPWIAWLRAPALRFSSLGLISARWSPRRLLSIVTPLLQALVLVGIVLSLARPQKVQRETLRESDGIDILLVLDTSGSMQTPDMGGGGRGLSRLDAARLVIDRFIQERPNDRIGLVVFGQEAFVQVPLTLDHDGLRALVGQVQIGMAGQNATAVGTAAAIGLKRMKELDAPTRLMILVTDGRSNAGTVTPLQAAEAAKALGVRLYTIGVGGGGGGGLLGILGGGRSDVDERTLTAMATMTGGRFYRATDASALAAVYQEIDTLEKSTAKVKEYVHRDELYLRILLPTILLFLCETLLSATLLRRLP